MILNVINWNVDPEIFHIGPFSIRYYGVLFALGFLIGYNILERMFKFEKVPEAWLEKVFMYTIIATVIGARFGHVFFYGWDYYSQHPGEILQIWHGGLASHGGAIGIIIALIIYSKKVSHKSPLWIIDRLVIPTALAGTFIRIGNLFNSEIYGHATNLAWGFIFQQNNEVVAKHPTQIYEAVSYFIIFLILMYMFWKTKNARNRQGLLTGVFFIGVFGARFLIEFVKQNQEAFENNMIINMGQTLSIPFILTGIFLIIRAMQRPYKIEKF